MTIAEGGTSDFGIAARTYPHGASIAAKVSTFGVLFLPKVVLMKFSLRPISSETERMLLPESLAALFHALRASICSNRRI